MDTKTSVKSHESEANLDFKIEGQGEQTIVFIHGWPDTIEVWDRQVESLRDKYRCVRFPLPLFVRGSSLEIWQSR